ncbi:MAG TPA: xanthine dehydrogenase family protein subunit M [Anaerolineales bacterium]|nr:xanthine dehydrogenase family protein subunit M [Anaerolineales bacterium]
MKPAPFDYYAPTTVEQALAHLAEHGDEAKVLAGGQSLVPMMNFRLVQPSVLVDLNPIPDLAYIKPDEDGGLRIGALTRHFQVEMDPLVAARMPLLHEAVPKIGYPQIRRRGTFGGSICHADPSAELVAVSVALNGRFRLRSPKGERWIPAQDFFIGLFTTVLLPGELLVEVALPPLPARTGTSMMEVARRSHDFALVGVAAVVSLDGKGIIRQARMVFLSAGDRPMEARRAAEVLAGQAPTPEAIEAAAETAASGDIDPSSDIHATAEFRRHLAKVLARRALDQACQRAAEKE